MFIPGGLDTLPRAKKAETVAKGWKGGVGYLGAATRLTGVVRLYTGKTLPCDHAGAQCGACEVWVKNYGRAFFPLREPLLIQHPSHNCDNHQNTHQHLAARERAQSGVRVHAVRRTVEGRIDRASPPPERDDHPSNEGVHGEARGNVTSDGNRDGVGEVLGKSLGRVGWGGAFFWK